MATSTLGSGTLVLAGTTSGTTTVTATAVAGTTTLTLPAATDTLVGKATTDTLTNKTLTGAAMNGTLGATTPSTVAATTLTTSSTVTHNGGTANGVAYLDGSKVLTTGSALVFDGANLGIGTSSPANRLDVVATGDVAKFGNTKKLFVSTDSAGFGLFSAASQANTGIYASDTSNFIYFATSSTEKARIDSSGNLLVGATATISAGPTSRVISYAGSASTAAISAQYGNSYTGQLYRADSLTTSGTGWSYFMGLSGNGTSITTTQIQILGNGNIQNTNNSYGAISDIKRKENITDATPKLEKLNQVRVVNFNMIGEEQKQLGVIAQELEQVFPSMIEETPDRDVEGNNLGTTTKSVKYSVFVPMLIKAIQEQQALIQTLTARITALESA